MRSRIGSKIIKRYDIAKTPYQRVIECNQIEDRRKEQIERIYKSLKLAELKRKITYLQEELFEKIRRKRIYEKRKFGKEEVFV
ncbi:MAG: hypothetical protein NC816_01310 [Candidatus Omnitrophica bacterium]|nr:hypothetical protein [Candidatus Omnitrophota bacterium]